jgi:hypothetical protein
MEMKMPCCVLLPAVVVAVGLFAAAPPAVAALPDLVVVNSNPVASFVANGPAVFRATIRNDGDAPSPATTFCVLAMPDVRDAFGIPAATPGCSWPLPALAPGASNELLFAAPGHQLLLPPGNYSIETSVNIEPARTITESNYDNNGRLFNFTVTAATPSPAWNRKPAVTAVKIIAIKPNPYSGACPVTLQAAAEITMNGPGTARYQWSNGKFASASLTEVFSKAGTRTVKYKVTGMDALLEAPWRLAVVSPNAIETTVPAPSVTCVPAAAIKPPAATLQPVRTLPK